MHELGERFFGKRVLKNVFALSSLITSDIGVTVIER